MSTEATNKPPPEEVTPGDSIRKWFEDFINLREGSDREGAIHSIVSGKLMRGSNAWMLVCSIMIACLGLNLNSGAVIIGAMLISPLMNPILGVGLGIGTNDRNMLWQALKNFGIAIAIALITSILYFAVTPIDVFTDEMQARTAPTILDGMVAVFGGLAGIISVTRLDKTNAIPGVAIATALMPPLCVAGYGIVFSFTDAEQGLSIFWRAGYLFFLNSFFVAVTAYIIIRILRFPYRKFVNAKEKRRSQLIIGLVSILMILPGIYVLNDVISKLREKNAAKEFTMKYFEDSEFTYKFINDHKDSLILVYPGKDKFLIADTVKRYTDILRNEYNLNVPEIRTNTDGLTRSMLDGIQGRLKEMGNQGSRIAKVEQDLRNLMTESVAQKEAVRYLPLDTARTNRIRRNLNISYPTIESAYFAVAQGTDSTQDYTLVALQRRWPEGRPSNSTRQADRDAIYRILQNEIRPDSLVLVLEEL